jgi:hypothetical protein
MQQPLRLPPQLDSISYFIGLFKNIKDNNVFLSIAVSVGKGHADAIILLAIGRSEDVWVTVARLIETDVVLPTVAINESFRHSSQVNLNEALRVNIQQLLSNYIHSWLSNLDNDVCLGVSRWHSYVECKWAAIERLTDLETITAT